MFLLISSGVVLLEISSTTWANKVIIHRFLPLQTAL